MMQPVPRAGSLAAARGARPNLMQASSPPPGPEAPCLSPEATPRRDEMMMLFHPYHKGSPLDGGPPYQAP